MLGRLGLAYLRQQHTQRGLGCPASAGAGPPTQLSHCPNLGLTCQPPPLTTVLISQLKTSQSRNEQNYVILIPRDYDHDKDNDWCDGDVVATHTSAVLTQASADATVLISGKLATQAKLNKIFFITGKIFRYTAVFGNLQINC